MWGGKEIHHLLLKKNHFQYVTFFDWFLTQNWLKSQLPVSIASTIYFHLVLGIDREFLRGYFFKGHFKANFGEHVSKVIYFEVVKNCSWGTT